MGTTLTGTTPQDTYDSLIKVTDNGPLSATAKYLSDGLGNDSVLALSTSKVGIATNTPAVELHVETSGTGTTAMSNVITTFRSKAAGRDIDIQFSDGTNQAYIGSLSGAFYIGTGGANERMRITSAGNVGIGTAAPASILAVSAASPTITLTATTTTATTIGNKNNRLLLLSDSTTAGNGGEVVFGTGDTNIGRWGAISGNITANNGTGSAGSIIFATKAAAVDTSLTERMRVLPDGGLTFNGDTAQANALDDYEEGTWTMGVSFGGASTGVTFANNTGTYTKIGRQVTVTGYANLTSKGSSTGAAAITGLPFTIANTLTAYSAVTIHLDKVTFANQYSGYGVVGNTFIELREVTEAGVDTALTNTDFANDSSWVISLTYFV
jgi:hypothetical protein